MIQRLLIIALFVIVTAQNITAQNMRYKRFQFDWPTEAPKTIVLTPQFQNEDVVIVDENTEMFIYQGIGQVTFIKKYLRLRFNNQEGINKASRLVLPESFYPQADYSFTNVEHRDSIHEPTGDYDCMEYFVARIIKPDGKIVPAQITDSVEFQRYFINMKTTTYYSFHFMVKNLMPGDDLEINYGVRDIYEATNTIFFHGIFPKVYSKLSVAYNGDFHKYYFMEHHGAKGVVSKIDNGIYTEQIQYEFSDLPGCMDEPNSRPFLELPHVNFYKHDLNYGIWNESRTIIQKYLPYTWDYINLINIRYVDQIELKGGISLDKDILAVRRFIREHTAKINDTSYLTKCMHLHNEIAVNFKYQKDDDFYAGTDYRLPRIPEFLEKKTLRQISRYTIYSKTFFEMRFDYYITFLKDKRINKIDFKRYEGVVSKDAFYCVIKDEKVNYFQPKFHRFGYFANELPFYYEDVPCILIPQRVPYEEQAKEIKTIKYVYINTPFSTVAENIRNVNVLATVSLDSLKTSFKSNIKLSGQFSTMTRGTYLYDFVDTTVTKQYGEKIYDNLNTVSKGKIEIVSVDSLFPFKSEFNVGYSGIKSIIKNSKTYEIDLGGWFKHIHDTLVTSNCRDLTYYPDFMYQDRWKYFIKFDHPVKIVSVPENIEIAGQPCAYKFSATQVQPDVIMLESTLVIKSESVTVSELNFIENSYKAIAAMNNSRLIVTE